MKTYVAPEMNLITYVSVETIGTTLEGSNTYNDGELEW